MSLARLWRQRGKTRETHYLLAEIYVWFTEDFATADLREVKALLQELASDEEWGRTHKPNRQSPPKSR